MAEMSCRKQNYASHFFFLLYLFVKLSCVSATDCTLLREGSSIARPAVLPPEKAARFPSGLIRNDSNHELLCWVRETAVLGGKAEGL